MTVTVTPSSNRPSKHWAICGSCFTCALWSTLSFVESRPQAVMTTKTSRRRMPLVQEQLTFLAPPEYGEDCMAAPPVWTTLNAEQRAAAIALLARLLATQMAVSREHPPINTNQEKEAPKDE
jgi:hypothetical protein